MTRVLLTGMSGTGKSSIIAELRRLGYRAVDMDEPGWSAYDTDGHQLWCEEPLAKLLATDRSEHLFVSGCAENQGKFYPQFDHIVLLSAPADVMRRRLGARTNNTYGKRPGELAEVLHNLETIEPLIRRGATHEIVTTMPLDSVVETVLSIAQG